MKRVYYELGYEVRMRITFATIAGFFFALAFVFAAMGTLLGGFILGSFAAFSIWLATNNKWFVRERSKS